MIRFFEGVALGMGWGLATSLLVGTILLLPMALG
jgi:hypothetical protein